MAGPGFKERESPYRSTTEFQQPPKVDENLQYVPKKALPEMLLSPKKDPQPTALVMDNANRIGEIHNDRVERGIIEPLRLDKSTTLGDFLTGLNWDQIQRIRTTKDGHFYSFAVETDEKSEKKKRIVTLGIGPTATTLTVSDTKGAILAHVVQEGGQMAFYSPKTGTA